MMLGAAVTQIGGGEVVLDVEGVTRGVLNDYVLIFAGGVLPTKFLVDAGVEVQKFEGEKYDPAN